MKLLKKPIFTGFAPNMTLQDILTACQFLFLPWMWKKWKAGENIVKVETWLRDFFSVKHGLTFDSGRSALYYALKSLGVGEGDDVLVQGYTCAVVSNAIHWTGAVPVYVDVADDLNMDPDDLKKKLTAKSKVLIIQHTFGLPARLDELLAIARENNLKVIEDCAHSLAATYKGKLAGTFGDIGMFSFGSEKVVSCVRGGALITNDETIAKKLMEFRSRLSHFDRFRLCQYLRSYFVFAIAKPIYNLYIGKLILRISRACNVIPRIIEPAEKQGRHPAFYPALFPNALATILLGQLKNLEATNQHRAKIAKLYADSLAGKVQTQSDSGAERMWLYYSMYVKSPTTLAMLAKREGILLGTDWTGSVIVPKDSTLAAAGYQKGSCPNAERLSRHIVHLPTNVHITGTDVDRVVRLVNAREK